MTERRPPVAGAWIVLLVGCAGPLAPPAVQEERRPTAPAARAALRVEPGPSVSAVGLASPAQAPAPPASTDEGPTFVAHLMGRCAVTPYWLSQDRARLASCSEGVELTFLDVPSGAVVEHHTVSTTPSAAALAAARDWLTFAPLLRYRALPEPMRSEREIRAVPPHRAEGQGLIVRLAGTTLTMSDRRGAVWFRQAYPEWRRDDFSNEGCHHLEQIEGVLRDVWGDRDSGVFFVRLVGTSGFEGCGHVEHVVVAAPLATPLEP